MFETSKQLKYHYLKKHSNYVLLRLVASGYFSSLANTTLTSIVTNILA